MFLTKRNGAAEGEGGGKLRMEDVMTERQFGKRERVWVGGGSWVNR